MVVSGERFEKEEGGVRERGGGGGGGLEDIQTMALPPSGG